MKNSMFRLTLLILGFVLVSSVGIAADSEKISLYDLKSKWKDISNQDTTIAVARGSYVIMAMVYTGCPHACPMTISKIQEIEKAINKSGVNNLKLVLASFDVKNDRPEKLKKYQIGRGLDPEKWHFLAANSEADARELAVALGISYKNIGGGDFSHSNVISLIDQNGVVIGKIDNLNDSPSVLVEAIKGLK